MLISKLIQIEFADPRIRAKEAIVDIRKAAESASLNLFARHDVRLEMPKLTDDYKVVMEVRIPEDKLEFFSDKSMGRHLRGISDYLMKLEGGQYNYKEYQVGKRLLLYSELDPTQDVTEKMSSVARLEALISFARLLERSDEEAAEYISRIITLLDDAHDREKYRQ